MRPITLSSRMEKVFERMVNERFCGREKKINFVQVKTDLEEEDRVQTI